jgi:hypothetical protein
MVSKLIGDVEAYESSGADCQSFSGSNRIHQCRRIQEASTVSRTQFRLPAAYYRGGTSRAIIFRQQDLPKDRTEWEPIFCGAIGSPDPNGRQLDGLGGGISSLSKSVS